VQGGWVCRLSGFMCVAVGAGGCVCGVHASMHLPLNYSYCLHLRLTYS